MSKEIPEIFSAFRALMEEFIGKTRDEVLQVSKLQSSPHLFIRVAIERVKVHSKSAREQHWVLMKETNEK